MDFDKGIDCTLELIDYLSLQKTIDCYFKLGKINFHNLFHFPESVRVVLCFKRQIQ